MVRVFRKFGSCGVLFSNRYLEAMVSIFGNLTGVLKVQLLAKLKHVSSSSE